MKNNKNISYRNVKITDRFFSAYQRLAVEVVIPYQEAILNDEVEGAEKSHVFANFQIAAQEKEGAFYGFVFQDSDLYKWLEAVSYSLYLKPDDALLGRADNAIALIGRAQQADGYINTYFTINDQYEKFANLREAHELYCAGHMIEAAVSYYEATGNQNLLAIARKKADLIYDIFINQSKPGYPGHQEIELALMRLYRVFNEEKYLHLAKHFIDERGKSPSYFDEENARLDWFVWGKSNGDNRYNQSHLPVREQREAVGHAVRAVYMYTAMADIANETGDEELYKACEILWASITDRKMYLTGAIGSTSFSEAFTSDYDLPNDTIYGETCASIGLAFFAQKMLNINPDSNYADVIERVLYNSILSGMSLSGTNFFYCNPLEAEPGVSGVTHSYSHVKPSRPKWYACACCPPNIARFLTSLGDYIWAENDSQIFSHLFIGSMMESPAKNIKIELETDYPYQSSLNYHFSGSGLFDFCIRMPDWAKDFSLTLNGERIDILAFQNGYLKIRRKWDDGDVIIVDFPLKVRKIYANDKVRANAGKVAFMRGPLVYCAEECDNGKLQNIFIPRNSEPEILAFDPNLLNGVVPLSAQAIRAKSDEKLYSENPPAESLITVKLIPYYAWANRKEGQMRVWFNERN
ncbi:MAG: glycoside hydrolase family 127 protein [Lachnospiraceae bacterium]|nr:glycoside hydrolase family 127 protein [Lachnospiraceae bacterium]